MSESNGFLVLLPGQMIEIPQNSNLSWLRLFYALPREVVEKRPKYLDLPRNIRRVLDDETYREMLRSDSFLELVWDCYAWAAWQFFQVPGKGGAYQDIPGDWRNYSGDFPLWRMSYLILPHFRNKFEYEMDWSFQNLFAATPEHEIAWLTYQQFSNLVGNLTDLVVKEQSWQPIIDEIWNKRQPEDYNGRNRVRRDFVRTWTHSRTIPTLSLEELREDGAVSNGNVLYDAADPTADVETKVLEEDRIEGFKNRLNDTDRRILELRMEGYTQQQIADRVGFQVPSAVAKRIRHIANLFDDYVSSN